MTSSGFNAIISPTSSALPSPPSSPRTLHADSTTPSYSPTPSRGLEPPARFWRGDFYTVSPTSNSTSTTILRLESPDPVEYAEDDTAVRTQPSRYVDYLSHNWKIFGCHGSMLRGSGKRTAIVRDWKMHLGEYGRS